MAILSSFKNTVFLWVLIVSACGNTEKQSKNNQGETLGATQKPIIVGANTTEAYLELLKDKKVGVVANQTSVIFKKNGHTHLVDSLLSLDSGAGRCGGKSKRRIGLQDWITPDFSLWEQSKTIKGATAKSRCDSL